MNDLSPAEVLASYPPHADTIPTLLASRAAKQPEKPAFEFEDQTWSYGALESASTTLARELLARGLRKGDPLALVSVNTDLSVLLFFAAAKVGALFIPLNPAATDEDLAYMLGHSRARFIVSQPQDVLRVQRVSSRIDPASVVIDLVALREMAAPGSDANGAAPLPEIAPDDPAIVIFTSGTTGFPKGAVHTQRNYVLAGEAFVARMHLQPSERLLTLLPFFHINALFYSLGGGIAAGATVITARSFSASRFWHFAAERRATQFNFLAASGTILMKRSRSEFNPGHCIRKMYGGPMSAEMLRVFRDEFHVPWMIEGYGMTEIPGASCNPFLGPHVQGSIGVPAVHPRFPGNFSQLRVVDEEGRDVPVGEVGELVVKTPIVFKEYLNDPEQTAAAFRDGWFLTGDLARRDERGYFYFVARKKDIIRRRGENIAGAELDRIISAHPDVQEAAAIGVPSDLGEEEILVAVVPRSGARIEATDIVEWCRARLSPMKVPRYVVFTEGLPHTASHRVAKHRIKADTQLIARALDMQAASTRPEP